MFLKVESIKKIINAIISDATKTTIELLCNSSQEGQETLLINSSTLSFINSLNFNISIFLCARVAGLEPTANGFGDHYSTN